MYECYHIDDTLNVDAIQAHIIRFDSTGWILRWSNWRLLLHLQEPVKTASQQIYQYLLKHPMRVYGSLLPYLSLHNLDFVKI